MTINRDQGGFDRFSTADEGPLSVLALPWLPVLVVPVAVRPKGTVATEPHEPHGADGVAARLIEAVRASANQVGAEVALVQEGGTMSVGLRGPGI